MGESSSVGDIRGRRGQQRFLKGRRMDGSSTDVAKNPGRHAPQRTSATREITVSLPINIVALVKSTPTALSCLGKRRAKFGRNWLRGDRSASCAQIALHFLQANFWPRIKWSASPNR